MECIAVEPERGDCGRRGEVRVDERVIRERLRRRVRRAQRETLHGERTAAAQCDRRAVRADDASIDGGGADVPIGREQWPTRLPIDQLSRRAWGVEDLKPVHAWHQASLGLLARLRRGKQKGVPCEITRNQRGVESGPRRADVGGRLQREQLRVASGGLQQLLVVSVLDDPAVVEYINPVGRPHAGEPVRDQEHRASGEELTNTVEEHALGARVESRCRLVEDHEGSVAEERAGEGDELPLPDREVVTARELAAEDRVVGVRQRVDERIGAGSAGSRDDGVEVLYLLVPSERDVLARGEEVSLEVLEYDRDRFSNSFQTDLGQIDVIPRDATRCGAIQAREDLGQRRLSRAVLTHEGHDLAGADLQRDAVERGAIRFGVRKADVVDSQHPERGRRTPLRLVGWRLEPQEGGVVGDEERRFVQSGGARVQSAQTAPELIEAEYRRAGRRQWHASPDEQERQDTCRERRQTRRRRRSDERAARASPRQSAQFVDPRVVKPIVAPPQEVSGVEGTHFLCGVAPREQDSEVVPLAIVGRHRPRECVEVARVAGGDEPERANVKFQWGAGFVTQDVAIDLSATSTTTFTNKTMSNDSNTFPFVGAYNAIIYKSGTVYKSKKGDGTLLASSTTLDTVVQAALDQKGLILWASSPDFVLYQPSNLVAWNIHENTHLIMGAQLIVSSAYSGTLFTIDDTYGGDHSVHNVVIDNLVCTQGGTPSMTWTALQLKSASNSGGAGGISTCQFRNMYLRDCGTGIYLNASAGTNSFINGNMFDSITVYTPHIGFDFNCPGGNSANQTSHRNTFTNCISQANSNVDDQSQQAMINGYRNIAGRENTFYNCKSWDVTPSNTCCNITSGGVDTVIHGGLMTYTPEDWEITQDLGARTVVFPANIDSHSGYNTALTNPFIRKTGTWNGASSTGATTVAGDGLLNTLGTVTAGTGVYSKPTATADGIPQRMDTGATQDVQVGIRTQVNPAFRYFYPFYKCRFKLNQTTAQRIFVGFCSSTASTINTADDPLVSLSGYGLYHSTTHGTSATNWLIARNSGTATSTFTDTGIPANITTPQTILTGAYEEATPWFRCRVGTNAASAKATSIFPAQFTGLNVGIFLSNTTAASKTCDVYSMFYKNGRADPF